MENRLAKLEDLGEIMGLISEAQTFMKRQGIDQWQDNQPDENLFIDDINRGECHLLISAGNIMAVLTTTEVPETVYEKVVGGKWLTEGEKYLTLHRCAVSKNCRNKGIGHEILSFTENIAEKCGAKSVRVDTHLDNKPMRGLLEKCAYSHCGTVWLKGEDVPLYYREVYEKII